MARSGPRRRPCCPGTPPRPRPPEAFQGTGFWGRERFLLVRGPFSLYMKGCVVGVIWSPAGGRDLGGSKSLSSRLGLSIVMALGLAHTWGRCESELVNFVYV